MPATSPERVVAKYLEDMGHEGELGALDTLRMIDLVWHELARARREGCAECPHPEACPRRPRADSATS